VSLLVRPAKVRLHALRRTGQPQPEAVIARPGRWAVRPQAEQALHPPDVGFRAAAAELAVEVDPLHHSTVPGARLLQPGHGPDLVRPDPLVLIEQEYWNPGRPDQLIGLPDA